MSERKFPDIYADGIQVGAGPYGITLTLYRSDPDAAQPGSPGAIVGRVRLSSELATALLKILPGALENRPKPRIDRSKPAGDE